MKVWITKDGRELIIADMTYSQISLLISQLSRSKDPMAKRYMKIFNKELAERAKTKSNDS